MLNLVHHSRPAFIHAIWKLLYHETHTLVISSSKYVTDIPVNSMLKYYRTVITLKCTSGSISLYHSYFDCKLKKLHREYRESEGNQSH